jgi:hypothetical protein
MKTATMKTTKAKPEVTKAVWRNRYRDEVTVRKVSPTAWLFDCDTEGCWRFSDSFIDPSGGPFVQVGALLSHLHPSLPDKKIISIKYGVYDTDQSGYEYTGYLLLTE